MLKQEATRLGALIQAYLLARWGEEPDASALTELAAGLEPGLRDRIDVLGLDGERLLDVGAEAVLAELESLERAAAREDARVANAADRIRGREAKQHSAARPERRDPRVPPGRPRPSAGPGGRRSRGQRRSPQR
ncbi:hypothetical protein ABC977_08815 [Thioalkalicoccus limnaeus]|uniref:Uncharacterized protein n=1 Tax=Thioalkalicoccus limnaeus TaxID=120681 RepID=A0ABV4BFD6_9GAMM